jgi:hypothetical protein
VSVQGKMAKFHQLLASRNEGWLTSWKLRGIILDCGLGIGYELPFPINNVAELGYNWEAIERK